MSNKYIINMKKDIGRLTNSQEIIKMMSLNVWKGEDKNVVDNLGYLEKYCDQYQSTKNAKVTKLKLFEYFLINNKNDKYLWLFEDDVYISKEFKNNYKNYYHKIKRFLNHNDVALLYLGVTNNYKLKHDNGLNFEKLSVDNISKSCSGAFAVVINKNILGQLISLIKNPSFEKFPFDNSCLGRIQNNYKNSCYVCDPFLFVPDISFSNIRDSYDQSLYWKSMTIDKLKYEIKPKNNIFVIITSMVNTQVFENLIYTLKSFLPLFNVAYVVKNSLYNGLKNIIKNDNSVELFENDYNNSINTYKSNYHIILFENSAIKYYDTENILKIINSNVHKYKKIILENNITIVSNISNSNENLKLKQ